jgi:hypothetical protein
LLDRLENPRLEEDVDILHARFVVHACKSFLISLRSHHPVVVTNLSTRKR